MKFLGFSLPVLILLALSSPVRATDRLAIRVSPAVAFAPANLVIRTTIEADNRNRVIEVVAESDGFYRSSEMQLDGEHAPRTSVFEFRAMPVGRYSVRAELLGESGREIASAQSNVNIVASGGY